MFRLSTWLSLAMLVAPACLAEPVPDAAPAEQPPEEVVVTGEYPGPGMWKVRRPDDADQHVLWILGDPPPLPKRMKWRSREVEARVRASQEVLLPSVLTMELEGKIGFFKGLTLLPAALRARHNPDDLKLEQVLPAEVYERWQEQKWPYFGRNPGIERWRPVFVAEKLTQKAFEKNGLRRGLVRADVVKWAKEQEVKRTTPAFKVTVPAKDIKTKMQQFARERLSDADCMSVTLELAEALANRERVEAAATAWANGDVQALAALPRLPEPGLPCTTALLSSQVAHEFIPSDIKPRLDALWVEAAEASLAQNVSTFAFLPFHELTSTRGRLAMLRDKGYIVEEP